MIQFENVTKTYAGGKARAVDGLNMQIADGKVFGFIGPNGAGKTTTIKLLTGILSPDSGRVLLNGIDMARDPIAAKRSFGYVPDAFDMYERLTGKFHGRSLRRGRGEPQTAHREVPFAL